LHIYLFQLLYLLDCKSEVTNSPRPADPLNLTQQLRALHITPRRGVIVSLPIHFYPCKPEPYV